MGMNINNENQPNNINVKTTLIIGSKAIKPLRYDITTAVRYEFWDTFSPLY